MAIMVRHGYQRMTVASFEKPMYLNLQEQKLLMLIAF